MQRVFWAINIDIANTDNRLFDLIPELKSKFNNLSNINWTVPENYHITLNFIGNMPDKYIHSLLSNVKTRLSQNPGGCSDLQLEISGFGLLSPEHINKSDKTNILVAFIKPCEKLSYLYQEIKLAVSEVLLSKDNKNLDLDLDFVPHITLAKMSNKLNNIKHIREVDFKEINIRASSLYIEVTEIYLLNSLDITQHNKSSDALAGIGGGGSRVKYDVLGVLAVP